MEVLKGNVNWVSSKWIVFMMIRLPSIAGNEDPAHFVLVVHDYPIV